MFGPKKWWVDFSTVTYLSATLRIQANCSALIAMQDNEYHRTILASRGSSDYEDFIDSEVPSLLEFLRNGFTFELRLRSKKIQKVIITLEMMENDGNSYCNRICSRDSYHVSKWGNHYFATVQIRLSPHFCSSGSRSFAKKNTSIRSLLHDELQDLRKVPSKRFMGFKHSTHFQVFFEAFKVCCDSTWVS